MQALKFTGLLLAIFSTAFNTASADDAKIDIVIKGGRVVDGTGAPWYVKPDCSSPSTSAAST